MPQSDPAQPDNADLEEEVLPDWGIINRASAQNGIDIHGETIPKRSDKYFDQDGSSTQTGKLHESKHQMYLALLSIRGHHIKLLLVAVWIPSKKMALVPHAKGNYFKDIGVAHNFKNKPKMQGMWLTPIETVYLTERGSIITYLASDDFAVFMDSEESEFDYDTLMQLPMSHLYSLALADNDLLDRYLVYALLKRSGYLIMDFRQYFNQFEHLNDITRPQPRASLFAKVRDFFGRLGWFSKSVAKSFHYRCTHYLDYTLIFESLQYLNSYSAFDSLLLPPLPDKRYEMTFNVWKPNQAFSKKNPPMPDFQVCVLNIDHVPFPPLSAVQSMWNQLNFSFAPTESSEPTPKKVNNKKREPTKKELRLQRKKERESKLDTRIIERNKYLKLRDSKLKQGSTGRSIVLAAIDNGIVNFTALNETEFKLTSNVSVSDLNNIMAKPSHGTVWMPPIKL